MRAHDLAGQGGGTGPAGPVSAAIGMTERLRALAAAIPYVRCPVCAGQVRLLGSRLVCSRGHAFDIARHGYVNLVSGRPGPGTADSPGMVEARDRFLGRAHYRRIADAAASLAARRDPSGPGLIADLAGGTGYYLARVLDALPHRCGLCVDLSAAALRRAARSHPRAAAIGADVWRPLPLADGSAAHVLSVFGPRNAAETSRILVSDGTLIIAAPGTAHLRELRERLGLIGIDRHKRARITDAFGDYAQVDETGVHMELELDHADLAALVSMGPSARHIVPTELTGRMLDLPASVTVTVDVQVSAWQRRNPGRNSKPAGRRARDAPAGRAQS